MNYDAARLSLKYGYTNVAAVDDGALTEMRALVRHALPLITGWRHHAIGAMQAYLVEDCEPEVRIHIWHPDLVRVDKERDAGRPHDHRFDLRSTVLAGSIGHEELHVTESHSGNLDEYTVQHARLGAAPLVATGRRLVASRVDGVIRAGFSYTFPARIYHRSFVPEAAITIVTKSNQKTDPARVLFPVGREPVFGVHPLDPSVAKKYVDIAMGLLR